MESDVVIALIGAISTITVGLLGYLSRRKQTNKRVQAENEISMQRVALDFGAFLSEWREITEEIHTLFDETELDRFLILRAFNGVESPRWTTAVLQLRKEGQKPVAYVHYELDKDYKDRLHLIQREGYDRIVTAELDECGIKYIYESEGVRDSFWAFIDKHQMTHPTSKQVASVITYCSFATMSKKGLDENTITRCRVLVGRLKGAAMMFHDQS